MKFLGQVRSRRGQAATRTDRCERAHYNSRIRGW